MKFYACENCKTIVATVKNSAVPAACCEQTLKEIIPGTTDAAVEKHVPAFTVEGNIVNVVVGSVEHPMTEAHYIEWIAIETTSGSQIKELTPSDAPKACFALCEGESLKAVYAYCNLHGLWKAE